MALIGITVAIMFIISLLSMVAGNSFFGLYLVNLVDTSAIINGSTTTFEIPIGNQTFGLDPMTAGISMIITFVAIGGALGISIFGSGLNTESIKIIMLGIFYISLWTLLSLLASNLIIAIEGFGLMIYLTLTILYALGVISKYFGGGGGGGEE